MIVPLDPLELILEQASSPASRRRSCCAPRSPSWCDAATSQERHPAAGLLLALALTFRDQMLVMTVPAGLYLLVIGRPQRRLAMLAGWQPC